MGHKTLPERRERLEDLRGNIAVACMEGELPSRAQVAA
jgi:hypothetical protein